jgi:hypothetical protein
MEITTEFHAKSNGVNKILNVQIRAARPNYSLSKSYANQPEDLVAYHTNIRPVLVSEL